jgi:hypothetical protein
MGGGGALEADEATQRGGEGRGRTTIGTRV